MTAPGLEEMLAGEIAALTGRRGETSIGGVAFSGGLKDMRRVNLWSRIANRVLVRIDEFHASTFYELERRAKQVDWARFVAEGPISSISSYVQEIAALSFGCGGRASGGGLQSKVGETSMS